MKDFYIFVWVICRPSQICLDLPKILQGEGDLHFKRAKFPSQHLLQGADQWEWHLMGKRSNGKREVLGKAKEVVGQLTQDCGAAVQSKRDTEGSSPSLREAHLHPGVAPKLTWILWGNQAWWESWLGRLGLCGIFDVTPACILVQRGLEHRRFLTISLPSYRRSLVVK